MTENELIRPSFKFQMNNDNSQQTKNPRFVEDTQRTAHM